MRIDITGDVAAEVHLIIDSATLAGESFHSEQVSYRAQLPFGGEVPVGLVLIEVTATGTNGLAHTETRSVTVQEALLE